MKEDHSKLDYIFEEIIENTKKMIEIGSTEEEVTKTKDIFSGKIYTENILNEFQNLFSLLENLDKKITKKTP